MHYVSRMSIYKRLVFSGYRRVGVLHGWQPDADVPLRVLLPPLLLDPHDHHDIPVREDGAPHPQNSHLRQEHSRPRGEQAGSVEKGHPENAG